MKLGSLPLPLVVALAGLLTPGDSAVAQATGTISGVVDLEPPPAPRRTANRGYGAGPAVAHQIQDVPAIVYLKGEVSGPRPPGYVANPEILQQDTAFVPAATVVMVGGTVSFPNGDPFFHNVFSMSGTKRFDLGRYPEGESKEVEFDKPGPVEVFCEVHDFMRGAVLVTENPYYAVANGDGSFTIQGVPPGTYTLVAWHPDHDAHEQEVMVTAGADTRVEVELSR